MVLLDKYCAGNRKPNSALLWEYDASNFDWQKSKVIVVQRVVEMGEPEDFFAAFDLYGGIDEPELKIIDVFICKLRKKLEKASGGKNYIETVWGRGYILKDPDEQK